MQMLDILPPEILLLIGYNLSVEEILNMEKVSKFFLKFIRQTPWNHFVVNVFDLIKLEIHHPFANNFIITFVKNHHFKKYNFAGCRKISVEIIQQLNGINTINLLGCQADMDVALKDFKCDKINLSHCPNVSDRTLESLQCSNIYLNNCIKVTDMALKYLSKCKMVSLIGCPQITDVGVSHLKNCQNLCIGGQNNITDKIFEYIQNCKVLRLEFCQTITDNGIQKLLNCQHLTIMYCPQITLSCVQELQKKGQIVYYQYM